MTVVLDRLTDAQTQIVEAIASVKDPIVSGVTTVTEFVARRVSDIPAMPFGKDIPTPAELVNNQYKFVKSIIDTNKDIALAAAKAAAPVTDKVLDRTTVHAAAKRPAARKAA